MADGCGWTVRMMMVVLVSEQRGERERRVTTYRLWKRYKASEVEER